MRQQLRKSSQAFVLAFLFFKCIESIQAVIKKIVPHQTLHLWIALTWASLSLKAPEMSLFKLTNNLLLRHF